MSWVRSIPRVNLSGVGTPHLLEVEWPTKKQPSRNNEGTSFRLERGQESSLSLKPLKRMFSEEANKPRVVPHPCNFRAGKVLEGKWLQVQGQVVLYS